MAKVNLKTRSGNRIIIVLDGKQVGLIQEVRGNDNYNPEAASGIGDIHVTEYVPTMADHTINVSTMVLNVGSLREKGISAENGDDMLRGLVFDIESYDKDTGALVRKYTGCSYASGDLEIRKHAIVMASGVFKALDVVSPKA